MSPLENMTSRQLVRDIIARKPVPRLGFWLGNPHPDTWPIYHKYFGTRSEEELRLKLGDDFRWITPQYRDSTYRHPEGKKIFDWHAAKASHGEAGPLAAAETTADVDAFDGGRGPGLCPGVHFRREGSSFDWPDPQYLDFTECLSALREAGDFYCASGFWAPFFHDVMDLFGIESYFVKMHTHPEVVHAVTARVCGFYLEANRRFFAQAGDLMDGYFFGNDFGTQLDLLISPAHFEEFVLPWFRRFTELARSRGYQVILHSCGAVCRVIPHLIEAGVDCLHPLQARAKNMDAEQLSTRFRGKIAFLGGIDTQQLLVQATPAQVKEEVRRLKDIFGPHWIVSPSHEALLPNVPPQNVAAMAEAARE